MSKQTISQPSVMNDFSLESGGRQHGLRINAWGVNRPRYFGQLCCDTHPDPVGARRRSCTHATLARVLWRDHPIETLYICLAMELEELSAEELVSRVRALIGSEEGDRLANELFRRHYERVACWCLRFTGDREWAADLAQEIFARAHRYLHSFQGNSKFSTWLFSIARNHCTNAMKARSIHPAESGEEELADLPDDNAWLASERESTSRMVHQLLDQALDETEKTVFTLHYGDELTLATITRLLGLKNESGAKAYIVSAKRKLNRYLQRLRARQQSSVLRD